VDAQDCKFDSGGPCRLEGLTRRVPIERFRDASDNPPDDVKVVIEL
jgi:hypothetical protein